MPGINHYHYTEFANTEWLLSLKCEKKVTVSVAIPTLNEESTISAILEITKSSLMENVPLIDELVVLDSGSTDLTTSIVRQHGCRVIGPNTAVPRQSRAYVGKGENLWKSLYFTQGDIIIWIDADIRNFHTGFITGLLGPLLASDDLSYATAYYQRPYELSPESFSDEGGRVTEILVRPFLNLFFPELSSFHQPMAGEHAGRRRLLEQIPFFTGYAVDVGHLVNITKQFGKDAICEVNLDKRIHRNRDLGVLSQQAFGVLQALVQLAEEWQRLRILERWYQFRSLRQLGEGCEDASLDIIEGLRPPLITVPDYSKLLAQRDQWHSNDDLWVGSS